MASLIRPDELPRWVPGELLLCSDARGWKGVGVRGYRYQGSDVEVPPLADYMIVRYQRGSTLMERRFEGRWTRTECHPGDVSLLTRSQMSHWHWTQPIDVTHTYLADDLVARVAADVLDRPIAEVRLHDLLRTQDPIVTNIVDAIAQESGDEGVGGALYVDALGTQLAVHLLRHYASFEFRDQSGRGRLPPAAARRVVEYIDARLEMALTLDELAGVVGMGVWSFGKRFRETFGTTPHHFVVDRRLDRARQLLQQGSLPVKAVASACGFADQAHLTRVMRARLATTPAALRRDRAN
ncbi:helix-turn-helix domain-containing protein [Piscinibacter sp.]|uniref:helix-turn-helix domain-containing protein n=1 Tax=Piscinibacter sp. TaxID=1903157 RepID=UPI0039E625B4